MKTRQEVEAMRQHAYNMTLHAVDGAEEWQDPVRRQAYADGVEAALLWVLGDIGEIPDFELPKGLPS